MITKWLFISKWFSMLSTNPFSTGQSSSQLQWRPAWNCACPTIFPSYWTTPTNQIQIWHQKVYFSAAQFRHCSGRGWVQHRKTPCCIIMLLANASSPSNTKKNDQYLHELQGKSPISVDKCPNFSRQDLFLGLNDKSPIFPSPKTCSAHKQSHGCFRRWRERGIIMDRAAERWRQQVP